MATTREQFFECSFRSARNERSAQVRAWNAVDAKRMFLDMLAAEGIRESGKVTAVAVRYHQASPLALTLPQLRHASHS